jgi:hypothetical protein
MCLFYRDAVVIALRILLRIARLPLARSAEFERKMQVMERVTVVATLLPGATTNPCLSPSRLAVYAGVILAISVLAASVATAESVTVSRLSRAPRVNDFANPESSSIQTEMATIERLIQRTPVHSPLVSDPWAGDRRGCHYGSTGAVAVSRGHLGDAAATLWPRTRVRLGDMDDGRGDALCSVPLVC